MIQSGSLTSQVYGNIRDGEYLSAIRILEVSELDCVTQSLILMILGNLFKNLASSYFILYT